MEINKNELKIIEFYRNNLFFSGSIREIMQKLKSKSYQRIYEAVEELIKKKILNSKKIGNNRLISLDLSRETILLLGRGEFEVLKTVQSVPVYFAIPPPRVENHILPFLSILIEVTLLLGKAEFTVLYEIHVVPSNLPTPPFLVPIHLLPILSIVIVFIKLSGKPFIPLL